MMMLTFVKNVIMTGMMWMGRKKISNNNYMEAERIIIIDYKKRELNNKSVLSEGKCEAMDIAKVLLANDPERKYFTNTSKGHMRLQTMLHISQMLYCSKTGKPLFKDPMYAYPPRYDLLTKGRL